MKNTKQLTKAEIKKMYVIRSDDTLYDYMPANLSELASLIEVVPAEKLKDVIIKCINEGKASNNVNLFLSDACARTVGR